MLTQQASSRGRFVYKSSKADGALQAAAKGPSEERQAGRRSIH